MKLLTLLLLLVSFNASAQVMPKLGTHNYKGTKFYGMCIDGVEYLNHHPTISTYAQTTFPRLKPNGKPVTCNY